MPGEQVARSRDRAFDCGTSTGHPARIGWRPNVPTDKVDGVTEQAARMRRSLSADQVTALAARLLGDKHVQVAPVKTPGMETQSFRIAGGNRTGCLRIGSNLRSFRKDAWAQTTFGKVLPVPQVWDLGELTNGSAYCLTSWAPGQTLQDLTADEINRATPLVFDAWTRLQTDAIDATSGFGDLDPDTLAGPYTSHHDRLRAELNDARKWPTTWTEPRSNAVSELLERYETLIEACPNDRAFIHGDWGTNNILSTADRLTAILDWEAAGIGDPPPRHRRTVLGILAAGLDLR